jgi:hypothetical protein
VKCISISKIFNNIYEKKLLLIETKKKAQIMQEDGKENEDATKSN